MMDTADPFTQETGELDLDALSRCEPWNCTATQFRDAALEGRIIALAPPAQQTGQKFPAEEAQMYRQVVTDIYRAVSHGRLFDMGHIPNTAIMPESKRAGALYSHGHIGHPFRQSYVLLHTWEQGTTGYVIIPLDGQRFIGCELQPMILGSKRVIVLADLIRLDETEPARYGGSFIPSPMREFARGTEFEADQNALFANICDPAMVCMLLLATDGVAVEKQDIPEKLNKARIKSGKAALPHHFRALTYDYITALRPRSERPSRMAQGGSHASPRPHIRRGHLRRLAENRTTWVRDALVMIVNEQEISRSHYRKDHIHADSAAPTRGSP